MNGFPLPSFSDNRKSAIQNPKLVWIVAIVITIAECGAVAQAQQPKQIPRIGYLAANPQGPSGEALRQGLKDLGYLEGKNL